MKNHWQLQGAVPYCCGYAVATVTGTTVHVKVPSTVLQPAVAIAALHNMRHMAGQKESGCVG